MRPSFQVSDEQLALRAYVENQPHGMFLSYAMVEDATGVTMDRRGRDALYEALQFAERLASNVRGVGSQLADADGVFPMMRQSSEKVRRAAKRAVTVGKRVDDQFRHDMSIEETKRLDLFIANTSALEHSLRKQSREYGNPARSVADTDRVEIPPEVRALQQTS